MGIILSELWRQRFLFRQFAFASYEIYSWTTLLMEITAFYVEISCISIFSFFRVFKPRFIIKAYTYFAHVAA